MPITEQQCIDFKNLMADFSNNKKINIESKFYELEQIEKKLLSVSNYYESSNHLAKLLSNVIEDKSVYSPLSIAFILSLLQLGSKENTLKQLTNLLQYVNSSEE
jgi:hypothetical protein